MGAIHPLAYHPDIAMRVDWEAKRFTKKYVLGDQEFGNHPRSVNLQVVNDGRTEKQKVLWGYGGKVKRKSVRFMSH